MAKIRGYSHAELLDLESQAEQLFTAAVNATMRRFVIHTGLTASVDPNISSIINDFAAMQQVWDFTVEDSLIEFVGDTYMGSGVTTAVSLNDNFFPDGAIGVPAIPNPIAEDYLLGASNRMKNFSTELWEVTQKQLHEGFEAGESISEIAARLQTAAGLAEPRAHVVARTEVHGAVESASVAQMRAVGFTNEEMNKQWEATEDSRTRPTHNLADGQIVALNEKFVVGGSMLDHPGDTTGPASETINCRCTTVFDVDVPPPITCVNPALVSATSTTVNTPDCICSTSGGTVSLGHVDDTRPSVQKLDDTQKTAIFDEFKNGHGKISPAYSGKKIYDTMVATHANLQHKGPPWDGLSLFDVIGIVDEQYTKDKVNGHPFASKLDEWLKTAAGKKSSGGLDFPTKSVSSSPPSAPKTAPPSSSVSAPSTSSVPATGPSVPTPVGTPAPKLTAYQKWKAKKLASGGTTPGPKVTPPPSAHPFDVMNIIKHYDPPIDNTFSSTEIYDIALDFLTNAVPSDFGALTDLKKWKAILKTIEQYQAKGVNLTPMEIARAWDFVTPGTDFEPSLIKWANSAIGRKRIAKDLVDNPKLLKYKPGTGPVAPVTPTPPVAPVTPIAPPTPVGKALSTAVEDVFGADSISHYIPTDASTVYKLFAKQLASKTGAIAEEEVWEALAETVKVYSGLIDDISPMQALKLITQHTNDDMFEKELLKWAKTADGEKKILGTALPKPVAKAAAKAATPTPSVPATVEEVLGDDFIAGLDVSDMHKIKQAFEDEIPYVFSFYKNPDLWDKLLSAVEKHNLATGDNISPLQMLKVVTHLSGGKDGYEKKILNWAKTAGGKKKILSSSMPSPSTAAKITAKKAAAKATKTTPKASVDISSIPDATKQDFYASFKTMGFDSYYTSPEASIWSGIQKTIAAHKAKYGVDLSPLQAVKIIDERGALKFGTPNTHLFENKIVAWMKTPTGKAVVSGKKAPSIPSYSAYPKPSGTSVYAPGPRPEVWAQAKNAKEFDQFMPKMIRPDVSTQAKPSSDFKYISTSKARKLQQDIDADLPLTDEERAGLRHYTGNNYTQMNGYLRGHVRGTKYTKTGEEQMRAIIWAQEGMRPSREDMLLFRGTDRHNFGLTDVADLDKLVGKTIQDEGFTSSSVGDSAAFGGEVLFEIEAPVGSSMHYVDPFSQFMGENEMLLAAGTKYKILSVTKRTVHGRTQYVVRGRIVA